MIDLYRAMSPRWSFAPLSGEGAALNGGRWNRRGQSALYLATDLFTAISEYQQKTGFKPATAALYRLADARLADLFDPASRRSLSVDDATMTCDWRLIDGLGGVPASWSVVDRLVADDFDGIIYPSRFTKGRCVVLWRWNTPGAPGLEVHDPGGLLPQNDRSWR